MSYINC
jgi:starvation-inducible DNA-binding protein